MRSHSARLAALALLTGLVPAASSFAAQFDSTQLRAWIGIACPRMVRDIRDGPEGSKASGGGIAYDGSFFFVADAGGGRELWRTNGTPSSTEIVRDLTILGQPLTGDSNPSGLTEYNGILYFSADDGHHGRELFRSDGTFAGTYLLKDINLETATPGYTDDSSPGGFFEHDGILYFGASDGVHGSELWRSDGTAPGTWMVKDLDTTPMPSDPNKTVSSSPQKFSEVAGWLVFQANLSSERGVWRSDGTAIATTLLQGSIDELNFLPLLYSGQLYFVGMTACQKVGLWTTNGTTAGTQQVSELGCEASVFDPRSLVEHGGIMYFRPRIFSTYELWRSDGTEPGTYNVRDLGGNVSGLTTYNGSLFFSGNDPGHGAELWKSDGTEVGTVLVKDINPGAASSSPLELRVYQGLLYFTANGGELWRSDGTGGGTTLVKNAGVDGHIVEHNGMLYFAGDDGVHGKELWRSKGTASSTYPLADSNPGGDFLPDDFFEANGRLYYWADNGSAGEELWTLAYCPFAFLTTLDSALIMAVTVRGEVRPLTGESDIPDEDVVPILAVIYDDERTRTSILRDLDANALPDQTPRVAHSFEEVLKNPETYYVYAPEDDAEQLRAVETVLELRRELQQSRPVPVLLLLPQGSRGHELLQKFEGPDRLAFFRGDCNDDGGVDISDPIFVLGVLFIGEGVIGCEDACDSNDDGTLDISDAINSLGVLFLGTGEFPPPGKDGCGIDPTVAGDRLDCDAFERCP